MATRVREGMTPGEYQAFDIEHPTLKWKTLTPALSQYSGRGSCEAGWVMCAICA